MLDQPWSWTGRFDCLDGERPAQRLTHEAEQGEFVVLVQGGSAGDSPAKCSVPLRQEIGKECWQAAWKAARRSKAPAEGAETEDGSLDLVDPGRLEVQIERCPIPTATFDQYPERLVV
jgi:hypothetical protein